MPICFRSIITLEMNKTVAHFIRKSTQLKASFIQNQVSFHANYRPVVVNRYESNRDDGGFAGLPTDGIRRLNLAQSRRFDPNLRYLTRLSGSGLQKALRFLDENEVSMLHFHYGTDACIYSEVMKVSGRPSVVSFYGYDSSFFRTSFAGLGKQLMNRRLFPWVTKVLAMSPDMRNDLLLMGCPEDKIIVHYYGSDIERFLMPADFRHSNADVTFLIISGLVPQKGHIFLLEAFRLAHQSNNRLRLRIVGAGIGDQEIRDFIQRNSMNSYVSMIGKVGYGSPQHLDELRAADVFIHPSVTAKNGDKEGIPGSIVEAMASGLPVISTYHAGIPYVIENEVTGLLVKEWDIAALAAAILELAGDEGRRRELGRNARWAAGKDFDIKKREIELENIYDTLGLASSNKKPGNRSCAASLE